MASSFELTLDTTSPVVNIDMPAAIVDKNTPVYIDIYASEELANWQNIYVIDSQGNKYDLIFDYNIDSFHGVVTFAEFPDGMASLYVECMDTVANRTKVSKLFNLATVVSGIGRARFELIVLADGNRAINSLVQVSFGAEVKAFNSLIYPVKVEPEPTPVTVDIVLETDPASTLISVTEIPDTVETVSVPVDTNPIPDAEPIPIENNETEEIKPRNKLLPYPYYNVEPDEHS